MSESRLAFTFSFTFVAAGTDLALTAPAQQHSPPYNQEKNDRTIFSLLDYFQDLPMRP